MVELADLAPSNKKSAIHVLHVDDDPSLLEITKLMLLDLDSSFEIENACCVDEAFGKIAVGHYDVVVSDYEMPQKDGLQFLKELREKNNKIPFILFTGKGREDVAIKALNLGADAYCNKQGNPETVYGELVHGIKQSAERRKTEQELIRSESKYVFLFSNMLNGFAYCRMLFDEDRKPVNFVYLEVNEAFTKLTGLKKEVVVGKKVTEAIPGIEKAHPELFEIYGRVALTGKEERFEIFFKPLEMWLSVGVYSPEKGYFIAVFENITERKKAYLEIKQKNEALESVTESIDSGLAVISKDYRVVWANKYLMDLGVAPNKKCYQTFNSSEVVCPDCGVKKIFEQNVSLDVHEFKTVNSKGETVWVELRVTPLKDKDGNVTAALELAVPITERKKAEEKIAWLASFPMLNPSPVLEVSSEGNISYLNSAAESIFPDLKKSGLSHPILSGWNDVLATFRNKKNRTFGRNIKINDAWFYMQFNLLQETQQVRIYITNVTEIKQAEEALQESETKFRMYVENSPVAVFVADPEGKYEYVNEAASKLLGYSIKELTDMDVSQIAFNDNKSAPLNSFASLQENGKIFVEKWLKKKDGQAVNVSLNAVKLPSGKLIAFCENITDQKKAEQTLKESEEKYRKLFEESMDAILVADIETGIIVDCNLAASNLVGRQKSELVGQHQSIITPKEQMDGEFARVFKQHIKDQTKTLETQIMRKTGEIRDVAVRDSIFELKGKKLMQRTFRDITDLKKANEQLWNMKEFDERIIDSLGDALLIIDPEDFTILNANKIAYEQLKLERKDIVGKTCWETTHLRSAPCEPPNHVCPIREMKRTSKPVIVEHTHFDSQQNEVIVEISAYPVKNEQGKTVVIHIAKDITQRKLMERELKESEAKFRTITNSVRDGIVLVDDHAKVTYWNPAAEKIFGYSSKEAIGKDVHQLVVPPTVSKIGRECIEIGVKTFTESGEGNFTAGNVELVGLRKNGSEFPAKLSLSPVNLGGKWSAVGVVKDITESKQAEQKLLEAEKRYHTLFSQAPLGVLIIDPQTEKAVEFNGVAHTQLGYSREEFSRLRISDFEEKKTEDEINAQITRILTTGEDEFETKHRAKNGELRDVLVTVKVIELEGKSLFNCVFHDITEIKKTQNALTESEKQYRQLVSAAQEGIWALNSNYQSVFVNPRMAELLGYAESEMVGKNLFEFLNKKCVDRAKRVFEQFKQGVKDHFDCELGRKNGSVIYVSIAVSVIKDDEGKPSGMLLMVSDITSRKVLEAKVNNYSKHLKSMVELRTVQLKDANDRVVKSERLAAIGELAGMVGHDLRNPLAGIKNAAYFLKKKGTAISEAQTKEMLETIDKAINHSDKIINDLLDYAREMHLELTKYAAHTLVDESIGMIQVPNRIQIVNQVDEEAWIWVNADKMIRVFINLIKNAVDAMPEQGTLRISSCRTRDCVEIAFADTGTGIPEETLQKLFTPLFTTKAQGMGFGLAICKRIIEAHGGAINVKTAVDKGTTFTVTLPLKPKVDDEGKKHA